MTFTTFPRLVPNLPEVIDWDATFAPDPRIQARRRRTDRARIRNDGDLSAVTTAKDEALAVRRAAVALGTFDGDDYLPWHTPELVVAALERFYSLTGEVNAVTRIPSTAKDGHDPAHLSPVAVPASPVTPSDGAA